jgi:integrase
VSAAAGVPIAVLSEFMGHSDIGVTTRVYVRFYDRSKAEDAFRRAIDDAMGGTSRT